MGDWIWGTAQGAFNEKATLSQIIVDAVIGMIPLVGDVTGVRDLIAIVIGLSTDPRKREEKLQWILLVIMLLALVPVIGGVVKGVGRLLVKAMGEVAHLAAGAQRAARLGEAAKDIVAFLNRVGVGNAEKFLKQLKGNSAATKLVRCGRAVEVSGRRNLSFLTKTPGRKSRSCRQCCQCTWCLRDSAAG